MLVQQGDGLDQVQVLHVVPPRAGLVVQERELPRIGNDHLDRPQQALGVLVQLNKLAGLARRPASFQRATFALVDRSCLLAAFVDLSARRLYLAA